MAEKEIVTVCKGLEFIENIGGNTSVFKVYLAIDDEPSLMYGDYVESQSFINQEVIVSFRVEHFKNADWRTINNLTVMSHVNVIDEFKDIKLYAQNIPDTEGNCLFEDIQIGQTFSDAVFYVVGQLRDSNKNRDWVRLTCIDKHRKAAYLRTFSPESTFVNLRGKYAKANIKRTKFGFNADDVVPQGGMSYRANPEIDIAKTYVQNSIKADTELNNYCNKVQLLNAIIDYGEDDGYEIGYELVRMAMEISQAKNITNMIPEIDVPLLIRGIVMSRAYIVLPSKYLSIPMRNFIAMANSPLARDKRLQCMLDKDSVVELPERKVLPQLRGVVDVLAYTRNTRNMVYSNDKMWGDLDARV